MAKSQSDANQSQTNQQVGVSNGVGIGAYGTGTFSEGEGQSATNGGINQKLTNSAQVSGVSGVGNTINITTSDIAAIQANEHIAANAIGTVSGVAALAIDDARKANVSNLELVAGNSAIAINAISTAQAQVANLAAQTAAGFQQITALAAPQSDAAEAELVATGQTPLSGVFQTPVDWQKIGLLVGLLASGLGIVYYLRKSK